MKTLIFVLAFAFIQLTGIADSNEKTTEFTVYGNCGMCKSRIEKALKVEGVESAKWDSKKQMVTVVYQSDKINEEQLHQLIADVGHDTENVNAKEETYNKLHACCQYERNDKASEKEMNKDHQHNH